MLVFVVDGPFFCVAEFDDFGQELHPDPTLEKTGSGSDPSKNRIPILVYVKFCTKKCMIKMAYKTYLRTKKFT
jgi:hypothetical protein